MSFGKFVLPILLGAMPMYADDIPALKFFQSLHAHRPDPAVSVGPEATNFNLTKNWHFTFFNLPLLAPLPGARLEDGSNIPNPFDLMGGIPYTNVMPPWLTDRSPEVESEYVRIATPTKKGHVTLSLRSAGDGSH